MHPLSTWAAQQPRCVAFLQRAWKRRRLHSSYLLLGADTAPALGIAWALAQTVLCRSAESQRRQGDACGTCAACRQVMAGSHPDLMELRPGGAAGQVSLAQAAALGRRLMRRADGGKVVLCPQAATLSVAVQNALLKAIEEPNGDALFVFVAKSRGALLPTVRSRCQSIVLQPAALAQRVAALCEAQVAKQLCEPLALLYGADLEAARGAEQDGFGEVLTALLRVVQPQAGLDAALETAAELSADAPRFTYAVALLEMMVHHSLAQRGGVALDAAAQTLCLPPQLGAAALDGLAAALQALRRRRQLNVNRSLALGELLLPLKAATAPAAGGSPAPSAGHSLAHSG